MEGRTMATKTVLAMAAALAGSLLAGGAVWAETTAAPQQTVQDTRITSEVVHKLNDDFPNWAAQIHVVTQNGVVTLSGYAETFTGEQQAVEDAHGVQGVTDVRNRLRVVG
jgi:hyperosmotically inducible periplasmic protein